MKYYVNLKLTENLKQTHIFIDVSKKCYLIPIHYSLTAPFPEYTFFISNQDQASDLKVAYIFKFPGAQSCLMVVQQFEVTYVSKECSNFQDSKPIFMINDFKIFPKILLRHIKLGALSFQQLLDAYYKRRTPLVCNLQILLLLSESRLSPESC